MKTEYKVIFDDYSEIKVSAFTGIQAKILAQAKRIEEGKTFAVYSVKVFNEYGVFEALDIPHLESAR